LNHSARFEAVVDRRHQRIGHRVRQTHQITVRPRGIDNDEIECPLDRADGVHKLLEFGTFVVGDLHGVAKLDAAMHREFQIEAAAARPGTSVVDVTGEALLAVDLPEPPFSLPITTTCAEPDWP
jgi:hypothetical protein